jgi:hypothetical protein
VLPVLFEGQVKAVMELSSFEQFSPIHQAFLDQLGGIDRHRAQHDRGQYPNRKPAQAISITGQRTAKPSRKNCNKPTSELQDKAKLLAEQNAEVERKNAEVEQARQALEEKAEQLAITSKYKSEFMANMSHELRTSAKQSAYFGGSNCPSTPKATCSQSRSSLLARFMPRATIC